MEMNSAGVWSVCFERSAVETPALPAGSPFAPAHASPKPEPHARITPAAARTRHVVRMKPPLTRTGHAGRPRDRGGGQGSGIGEAPRDPLGEMVHPVVAPEQLTVPEKGRNAEDPGGERPLRRGAQRVLHGGSGDACSEIGGVESAG